MKFLWKTQLKKERGKFLPKDAQARKKTSRKEQLSSTLKQPVHPYLGVGLLWTLFVGTGAYLVLASTYLVLQAPRISGLEQIDAQDFAGTVARELGEKYLGVVSRNRYFLVRPTTLEQDLLAAYPLIRKARVQPSFPDGLAIEVEEREALVVWCSADTCSHILEDGSTLPVTERYQDEANRSRTITLRDMSGEPLPVGTKVWEADSVALPALIRRSLREQFSLETESEMTLSSRFANELRVKTSEGWEIYFGIDIPLETSLQVLKLVFEKEITEERRRDLQYIDLRTENRVFYRYREGKEEVTEVETAPQEEKSEKDSKEKKKKD